MKIAKAIIGISRHQQQRSYMAAEAGSKEMKHQSYSENHA